MWPIVICNVYTYMPAHLAKLLFLVGVGGTRAFEHSGVKSGSPHFFIIYISTGETGMLRRLLLYDIVRYELYQLYCKCKGISIKGADILIPCIALFHKCWISWCELMKYKCCIILLIWCTLIEKQIIKTLNLWKQNQKPWVCQRFCSACYLIVAQRRNTLAAAYCVKTHYEKIPPNLRCCNFVKVDIIIF